MTYSVSDLTATATTVKVDGGADQTLPSGSPLNLSNGPHTVLVTATDAAGNVGSAQVNVKVDTAPPTVAIFSPAAGVVNAGSVLLKYAVSDGTVTVLVDGGAMNIASGSTISGFGNGSHTITVSSRDAAGNTGSASVTFLVVAAGTDIIDDTNIYCKGTGTYVAGASSFTSGISVPPSGNAVYIAAPAEGSAIAGSRTIVKGAMDTTIPVNSVMIIVTSGTTTAGYVAQVNGHYFAAKVPVTTDTTAITAIATDQNGGKHQKTVAVTVTAQSNYVDLLGTPSVGIPVQKGSDPASLDVSLTATPSLTWPVANYAWDFDGSGSEDVTCYSHNGIKASYRQTGLYLSKVSATDLEGNAYTDTEIVNVLDAEEMNATFGAIWDGMKNSLAEGRLSDARNYISNDVRSTFDKQFAAISQALPQYAASLGEIDLVRMYADFAEFQFEMNVNGTPHSFQALFGREVDGSWKILSF